MTAPTASGATANAQSPQSIPDMLAPKKTARRPVDCDDSAMGLAAALRLRSPPVMAPRAALPYSSSIHEQRGRGRTEAEVRPSRLRTR
jgi:hypothetical protein